MPSAKCHIADDERRLVVWHYFMPCRKSMIDLTVVGNKALSKEDMFKLAQKQAMVS